MSNETGIVEQEKQPDTRQEVTNLEPKSFYELRAENGSPLEDSKSDADKKEEANNDERRTLTDLDKANYSWSKKFDKEYGKRREAEEKASKAIEYARKMQEHSNELDKRFREISKTKPVRVESDVDGSEFINEMVQKQMLEQHLINEHASSQHRIEQAKRDAAHTSWTGKVESIKEIFTDWEDVVRNVANEPVNNDALLEITESELGPEIAYFLAKNISEVKKINELSPQARTRYLARLEMRIEDGLLDSFAKKKEVAKIKPTAIPSGTGSSTTPNAMSMDEYAKRRAQGKW